MTAAGLCGAVTGIFAVCLTAAPALATDYASNPNPACRLMRNVTPDAPYPAEPNRTDTQVAQTATALHNYRQALPRLLKIDRESTEALRQLPPDLPRIDLVIDRHLGNLQWARGAPGKERGGRRRRLVRRVARGLRPPRPVLQGRHVLRDRLLGALLDFKFAAGQLPALVLSLARLRRDWRDAHSGRPRHFQRRRCVACQSMGGQCYGAWRRAPARQRARLS
jgi:hypothetical protein